MAVRPIIALYFRQRWWFASQGLLNFSALASIPIGSRPSAYVWIDNTLHRFFNAGFSPWLLRTRLWDAGAPLREKQALNAAFAATLTGLATPGVSVTVDTEQSQVSIPLGSSLDTIQWVNALSVPVQWVNNVASPVAWTQAALGYRLLTGVAQAGARDAQYMGLTIEGDGTGDVSIVQLLSLLVEQSRDLMK
jgi:hypothetical protein